VSAPTYQIACDALQRDKVCMLLCSGKAGRDFLCRQGHLAPELELVPALLHAWGRTCCSVGGGGSDAVAASSSQRKAVLTALPACAARLQRRAEAPGWFVIEMLDQKRGGDGLPTAGAIERLPAEGATHC